MKTEIDNRPQTADCRRLFTLNSLVCCLLSAVCCLFFNPSDSLSEDLKKEQTQYERRLKMLGDRYSRAPAGTVEFPQELMAVDYINEGYKLFQKNQYDMALEAAQQALKYDAKSPVAHELAGDVFYLKQDLGKANEHYSQIFQTLHC